jgi:hypothetical protein
MPVTTRFSNQNDNNSFGGEAISSNGAAIAYAATLEMPRPPRRALKHFVQFAQLTGALTLNATNIVTRGDYEEGDEVNICVTCDGTARTITWGTLFRPAVAATWVIPINGTGLAKCIFLDGKLHVYSQSMLVTL